MERLRSYRAILSVVFCVASGTASAQSVDSPSIKAGDSWVYRSTIEKGSAGSTERRNEIVVTRATLSSIYYTTKEVGSTQVPRELIAPTDWSRVRSVDGVQTTVNKPLSFPLSPGKTWDIAYAESHPNKQHKSEKWANEYTVVGFETVEVPAGKFNALKIEAEGNWTAEIEPSTTAVQGAQVSTNGTSMVAQTNKTAASTATGHVYKVFWYAPDVKRWVKSTEEYYNANGVRSERFSDELESFKLTN
jgi:hypothetical protein